jgi:hypothetical protein
MFLRNVGIHLPDCMISYSRRSHASDLSTICDDEIVCCEYCVHVTQMHPSCRLKSQVNNTFPLRVHTPELASP